MIMENYRNNVCKLKNSIDLENDSDDYTGTDETKIINLETAISMLDELQAFALINPPEFTEKIGKLGNELTKVYANRLMLQKKQAKITSYL